MMTPTITVTDRIRQAMHAGEVLTVVYHGDNEPGTTRLIAPTSIDMEKGLVRAMCFETSGFRFFSLDRLAIVEERSSGIYASR